MGFYRRRTKCSSFASTKGVSAQDDVEGRRSVKTVPISAIAPPTVILNSLAIVLLRPLFRPKDLHGLLPQAREMQFLRLDKRRLGSG